MTAVATTEEEDTAEVADGAKSSDVSSEFQLSCGKRTVTGSHFMPWTLKSYDGYVREFYGCYVSDAILLFLIS